MGWWDGLPTERGIWYGHARLPCIEYRELGGAACVLAFIVWMQSFKYVRRAPRICGSVASTLKRYRCTSEAHSANPVLNFSTTFGSRVAATKTKNNNINDDVMACNTQYIEF